MDEIAKTVTVVETTNGNIFGGYTELPWDFSSASKFDNNVFIFRFVKQRNQPFIAISKNNSTGSTYWGPCFGTSNAFDFCIKSNSNTDKIS